MTIEEAREEFGNIVIFAIMGGNSFYLSDLLRTNQKLREIWDFYRKSNTETRGLFDALDERGFLLSRIKASFKYTENGPEFLSDDDFIMGAPSFNYYLEANPYEQQFCKFHPESFDEQGYITKETNDKCQQVFALMIKIEKSIYDDVPGSIQDIEDILHLLLNLLNEETRTKFIPSRAKFLNICEAIQTETFIDKDLDDFVELYYNELLVTVEDLKAFMTQFVQQCPGELLPW